MRPSQRITGTELAAETGKFSTALRVSLPQSSVSTSAPIADFGDRRFALQFPGDQVGGRGPGAQRLPCPRCLTQWGTAPCITRGSACLVTGGLGFIGSNLAVTLADAGAGVTVVDSLEPRHGGDRANVAGAEVEVVVADIADRDAVAAPLAEADFVFNLAGQVSHLDSMTDPLHDLDINAPSQLAFLEHVRKINPGVSIVYASRAGLDGRPQTAPVDETHQLDPVDAYVSRSRRGPPPPPRPPGLCAARQCCGCRTSTARASASTATTRSLCAACSRASRSPCSDGSQRRDCLYVDDAVTALLAAADNPSAYGEVYIGHDDQSRSCPCGVVDAAGSGEVVSAPWPEDRARIAIDSYWTDHSKSDADARLGAHLEPRRLLAATLEHYRSAVAWRASGGRRRPRSRPRTSSSWQPQHGDGARAPRCARSHPLASGVVRPRGARSSPASSASGRTSRAGATSSRSARGPTRCGSRSCTGSAPMDEAIVPAFTAVPTAAAVAAAGAAPSRLTSTPRPRRRRGRRRGRADRPNPVVVVHLYGRPSSPSWGFR